MKKSIFIIFLLIMQLSFGQKGKVLYKASMNNNYFTDLRQRKEISIKSLEQAEKDAKDVECVLMFDKTKSIFKKIDKLQVRDGMLVMNVTDARVGFNDFYYDIATKETLEIDNSLGETILIVNDAIKWKITNEVKKINGFNCIKATAVYKYMSSYNGIIKLDVIAWFTPQIPISFGPAFYNGLPGLIIILQEGSFSYTATSIILNSDESIEIKLPKKAKRLTQKEYDEIPY